MGYYQQRTALMLITHRLSVSWAICWSH